MNPEIVKTIGYLVLFVATIVISLGILFHQRSKLAHARAMSYDSAARGTDNIVAILLLIILPFACFGIRGYIIKTPKGNVSTEILGTQNGQADTLINSKDASPKKGHIGQINVLKGNPAIAQSDSGSKKATVKRLKESGNELASLLGSLFQLAIDKIDELSKKSASAQNAP